MPAPDASETFGFDRRGLEHALALLDAHLAARVPPVASAPTGEALPSDLPADGIGGSETLERLAPAVLGSAARLGDPAFFAHMDPPTPWMPASHRRP
jgi:L-2,4-diaminobutyrate decarboxylase